MRKLRFLLVFVCAAWLAGCANLLEPPLATPLPPEFVPTVIAMTLQAKNAQRSLTPSPSPEGRGGRETTTSVSETLVVTVSSTAALPATETPPPPPTEAELPATETPTSLPPSGFPPSVTLTATPFPEIPEARVQIYKLGDLSMVTSPLLVTSRLTSRVGKVVRFDLFGEDGRLLARQMKIYYDLPWHVASLSMELEFEIRAAAELGRLVISVEDAYGRVIDVNSVNLILLSSGAAELNPASALQESLVILDPTPKTLVVGGKVFVSGVAKPFDAQPLKVVLIAEDGSVLGQRLAGVDIPVPGGYGSFFAEVSYTVSQVTPVLLVVYESGGILSQYAHLTSRDIILAP